MTYYVAAINQGIGDVLICLPTIQALIKTGKKTVLVLRSRKQAAIAECIPGLAGVINEPEFLKLSLEPDDCYYNFRNHYLQTDCRWGSAQFVATFGNLRMTDIIKKISQDFDINADFHNLEKLPFKHIPDLVDSVVLVPGADSGTKMWSHMAWLELAKRCEQSGLKIVVLGQPERCLAVKELVSSGLNWLPTPKYQDLINAVSSCRAVISVDTGIMHLAVQQDIPTVAIFTSDPFYLRNASNYFPIIAPHAVPTALFSGGEVNLKNLFEWTDLAEPFSASPAESSLEAISFDLVLDKLNKALQTKSAVLCPPAIFPKLEPAV